MSDYPTEAAYNAVCEARTKWHGKVEKLQEDNRLLAAENSIYVDALERIHHMMSVGSAKGESFELSCVIICSAALSNTTKQTALVQEVLDAAVGLCRGSDWNDGTHAKTHGYKAKLISAVRKIKEPLC